MTKCTIDPLELILSEMRDFRQEFRDERETVNERLGRVERDISGAKLLGKTALGVSACIGGLISWAADVMPKLVSLLHK